MKASIDIKITYDDLSEACKEKIRKLEKELDCTVNLVYPDITSTPNITFGKTYPYIPYGSGSSGDWHINTPPHDVHDWKDNIVLCNAEVKCNTHKWKPDTTKIGKIQCPDGSIKSTSIHSQS